MKLIRNAQARSLDPQAGLTLIEIVVALMIFSIIAIGIALSITSALVTTRETRAREIAANLAAQEVDLDRSINDVFSIVDGSSTQTVNGTTFTITRTTDWITSTGAGNACGSTGGTLQYKQINVAVTWLGQATARTSAVRTDTVIAPNSRINDPTLGTILVSVRDSANFGAAGVTVTIAPAAVPNGAVALTTAVPLTDVQGCSYALKVTPGNYTVTLSKSGYVDPKLDPMPSKPVQVTAGSAASTTFAYDSGSTFAFTYASNYTGGGGSPKLPTNLDTSVFGPLNVKDFVGTVGSATIYPGAAYSVFAGAYVPVAGTSPTCLDVDPSQWTTPALDGAVGKPVLPFPASTTGTVNVGVAMGVVTVTGFSGSPYLTAVSTTPAFLSGDPGCSVPMTYTFPKQTSSSSMIALPFGTWMLYTGPTSGSLSNVVASTRMTPATRGTSTPVTNLLMLDPRMP